MEFYWSYKQVPELAALSPKHRAVVMKRINRVAVRHWEWWAAFLVLAVCTAIGAYAGGTGVSGMVGTAIGAGLGSVPLTQAVVHIGRKYHRHLLLPPGDA